ncbi:transketolase [Clostridiaceae bacterium M8S5]|nr:transketolase [Clostridiaceae bacterium M8S5]
MNIDKLTQLKQLALDARKDCINTQYEIQSGHLGGSFSALEMMIYLYFEKMNLSLSNTDDLNRDIFILSKGHASLGFYAVLGRKGLFPLDELTTYRKINSRLQGHTHIDSVKGIECSTGSLGQGLSFGLGIALAKKKKNLSGNVYVMLGDGEMQEGQIWEALMLQSKLQLENLIPIIDNNKLQLDNHYVEIMGAPNFRNRLLSFGLQVIEVNGNDFEDIEKGFNKLGNIPSIIVSDTIKGYGVSFMENSVKWHSKKLNKEEFNQATFELKELEVALNE